MTEDLLKRVDAILEALEPPIDAAVVIEAARGKIEQLRSELAYIRDIAKAYQETAVARARELAEARGLLERCIWHTDADDYHCLPCAHCRDNIRAYLDRTRPADVLECVVCGKHGGCEEHGSRPAPAPSANQGWYRAIPGALAPTPAPRCTYDCLFRHPEKGHAPDCPARRGAP